MSRIKAFTKKFYIEIFVFLFFVVIHLPGLGHETFNTDVWKWKARTYDFGEGVFTLNFEKTIQKYHPGVTLMWIGTFAVKVYNLYYDLAFGHPPINNDVQTVFELHMMQKFFLVVFISAVLGFSVYVLKKEFGKRVALVFGLLISLEPFYYALTRVFHLEGLMSTLMLASFLWYYYYLRENKFIRLILSAFFASLAFLTKTSAIYLVPFMALLQALSLTFSMKKPWQQPKAFFGQALSSFGPWLLLALAGFFLFWPAMWTMPGKALSTVYRGISTIGMERGHEQIYFGTVTTDPGAFYYLVVLALRTSPILLAGILGSFITVKYGNRKERFFILYLLLFALFYTVQITIPSKKLDRYILPAVLSLGLIASFFYAHVLHRIGKKFGFALLTFVLSLGIFTIYNLQLDYFAYFNPLLGGLRTGAQVLEPKWIIGQHEIVNWLETRGVLGDHSMTVAFPEKYYTQIWPFVEKAGFRPVIKDLTPHAKQAAFFFYPVWQDDSASEDRFDIVYTDTIYLQGVPVWKVYMCRSD